MMSPAPSTFRQQALSQGLLLLLVVLPSGDGKTKEGAAVAKTITFTIESCAKLISDLSISGSARRADT